MRNEQRGKGEQRGWTEKKRRPANLEFRNDENFSILKKLN
jgi:hypothetical protein